MSCPERVHLFPYYLIIFLLRVDLQGLNFSEHTSLFTIILFRFLPCLLYPHTFLLETLMLLALPRPHCRDTLGGKGVGQVHREAVWWGQQQETSVSTGFSVWHLSRKSVLAVTSSILLCIVCSLFKLEGLWAP